MQLISNYLFKTPEQPIEEPKLEWVKDGSAALVTSVAVYALSLLTVISTGIALSTITGIIFPGASLLLLYSSTLLATYGIDKVSKPFFDKAFGSAPTEKEESVERDYVKAAGYSAIGVITSFAIWALSTMGSIFAAGLTTRLILGRTSGIGARRLFWIFLAAPIAGSYLSIPAIHKVANPHFQKAKAYI